TEVRLWDVATGEAKAAVESRCYRGRCDGLRFSPDGRRLLVLVEGWHGDPTGRLWDLTQTPPRCPDDAVFREDVLPGRPAFRSDYLSAFLPDGGILAWSEPERLHVLD